MTRKIIHGTRAYLSTPSFSAAKSVAHSQAQDEFPGAIFGSLERQILSNVQQVSVEENEKDTIRRFFEINGFVYSFIEDPEADTTNSVCWSSPVMHVVN